MSHYSEHFFDFQALRVSCGRIDIWDNRLLPSFITSKEHPLASVFYHHENTACMEQVRLMQGSSATYVFADFGE